MNELCDPRYIHSLLLRHGFRFSKSMGQNFLIDAGVPEAIYEISDIDESCGVLEIGPGIGTLTRGLSALAGRVVSVELDRALLPVLRETLADCKNVTVIQGDILKTDIPELVKENMEGLRPVVCANLPYNITSPVIAALIEAGVFEEMTLMVQREVAGRICAGAGGRDYGALSVFVQYYYHSALRLEVPPEAFMPAPKVHSAVIRLQKRLEPPQALVPEKFFFRVVRAAFSQRRKTLVNSLGSVFGSSFDKAALTEIIRAEGHLPTVRGEELSIEEFSRVAGRLAEQDETKKC